MFVVSRVLCAVCGFVVCRSLFAVLCKLLLVGYWLLFVAGSLRTVRWWLFAACGLLLDGSLFVTCCWLYAECRWSCCSVVVVCCLMCVVRCVVSVACCVLFVACCWCVCLVSFVAWELCVGCGVLCVGCDVMSDVW